MPGHDTDPVPYPLALALTLVIEVPVYAVALAVAHLAPWPRAAVAGVIVNLATHPLLWWLLTAYSGLIVAGEVGAWLVETALLFAWLRRDAPLLALTALTANLASVLAGAALSG
jgi:hypothetical protein